MKCISTVFVMGFAACVGDADRCVCTNFCQSLSQLEVLWKRGPSSRLCSWARHPTYPHDRPSDIDVTQLLMEPRQRRNNETLFPSKHLKLGALGPQHIKDLQTVVPRPASLRLRHPGKSGRGWSSTRLLVASRRRHHSTPHGAIESSSRPRRALCPSPRQDPQTVLMPGTFLLYSHYHHFGASP